MCKKTVVKVPCEVYSRIVGYLTPVQNWNISKRQEKKERVVFKIPSAAEGHKETDGDKQD